MPLAIGSPALADSDVGKGSPIGLLVVLLLVVAVYFLYRSLNRHLRKLPPEFGSPEHPAPEHPAPKQQPTSDQPSAPEQQLAGEQSPAGDQPPDGEHVLEKRPERPEDNIG